MAVSKAMPGWLERATHYTIQKRFQQAVIIPGEAGVFIFRWSRSPSRFQAVPTASITYRPTYGTHMGTYTGKTLERGP